MLLLLAVIIHEGGHIGFLLLSGGKLRGAKFSLFGITLKADYPPSYFAKIMISLGGPLTGMLCFFLFHNAPMPFSQFAEINLCLSLFNLLPISFLDGGAALESLFLLLFPFACAMTLSHTLSVITATLLWAVAIYLFLFLNGSASLFLLSLWFFFSLFFFRKSENI